MRDIAQSVGFSGNPLAARDLYRLIADAHTADRRYRPNGPRVLNIRAELAAWTGQTGDASAARDQLAQQLHIYEHVWCRPNDPSVSIIRFNLARYTGEAGDAAAARDQFAALLPISERALGPDHPDTVATRSHFAHWAEKAAHPTT
jgi:hypothetical protein